MTIIAVADRRELAAAPDYRGIERCRCGAIDDRDRRPPRNGKAGRRAYNNDASDNGCGDARQPRHSPLSLSLPIRHHVVSRNLSWLRHEIKRPPINIRRAERNGPMAPK